MDRLKGRVVLITGAGAGIAKSAAAIFSREGASVVLAEIDAALGKTTERDVLASGGQALFVQTDVTREHSVRAVVDAALQRFGKLDTLFNCVGGSIAEDAPVAEVDMALWDRVLDLNLKSTVLCCRHAIPRIVAAGGGAVVNMSSGAALRGSSPSHLYTATKGAILSLTRALAGQHATHNVRVNAICAGRILTERILRAYGTADQPGPIVDRQKSSERAKEYPFWVGKPEDIANIALFLASDEARMITGATIQADGGRSSY